MVKQVQKDFFFEIAAKFSEIFEDDSTEKAVKKAHLQNTPGKDAKVTITDQRFKKTKRAPYVEYPVTFTSTGKVNVTLVLAPTWPLQPDAGLRYGLSLGSQKPVISDALAGFNGTDETWEQWVSDGVNLATNELKVKEVGPTTLRLYG